MLSNVKDYLIDLGLAVSHDKIKKSIQEKQVRERLENFIQRQGKCNYLCTTEEEVDFEALTDYLRSDLIADVRVEQFTLEQSEEVFYHSVVQTVAFTAHALPDTFPLEHPLILFVLVLPTLVRMKNQIGSIRYLLKSLVQHGRYHAQYWSVRDRIADQIAAMQIKNGREIEFLSKQTELCHIGNPLLVRLFGMEVPVQQVWCNLPNFTLVRTIFLHSDTANQAQFLHNPLDSLVIQAEIALVKFCCNAAIAVSPFVFVVNGYDFYLGSFILVYTVHPLQMIVKSCTGQLSDIQQ